MVGTGRRVTCVQTMPEKVSASHNKLKTFGWAAPAQNGVSVRIWIRFAHLFFPDLVGEPLVNVQGATLKTIGIAGFDLLTLRPPDQGG